MLWFYLWWRFLVSDFFFALILFHDMIYFPSCNLFRSTSSLATRIPCVPSPCLVSIFVFLIDDTPISCTTNIM